MHELLSRVDIVDVVGRHVELKRGGANLMGGEGSIYGAFIGAALIFLIRNSLIMFGVDANWYDLFVGLFIILAVLLERVRGRTRG